MNVYLLFWPEGTFITPGSNHRRVCVWKSKRTLQTHHTQEPDVLTMPSGYCLCQMGTTSSIKLLCLFSMFALKLPQARSSDFRFYLSVQKTKSQLSWNRSSCLSQRAITQTKPTKKKYFTKIVLQDKKPKSEIKQSNSKTLLDLNSHQHISSTAAFCSFN